MAPGTDNRVRSSSTTRRVSASGWRKRSIISAGWPFAVVAVKMGAAESLMVATSPSFTGCAPSEMVMSVSGTPAAASPETIAR